MQVSLACTSQHLLDFRMIALMPLEDNTFHSLQSSSPFSIFFIERSCSGSQCRRPSYPALLEVQKPLRGHALVVTPCLSVALYSVKMSTPILLLQRTMALLSVSPTNPRHQQLGKVHGAGLEFPFLNRND